MAYLRRDRIESDHPFRADDEETVVKLIPVLVDAIGYLGCLEVRLLGDCRQH
jgi:hypothetical protein